MNGALQTQLAPGVKTSRTALVSIIHHGQLKQIVIPGVPLTAESWMKMDTAIGLTLTTICEPYFLEAARLWTSLIKLLLFTKIHLP
jgi:hypothetical protein